MAAYPLPAVPHSSLPGRARKGRPTSARSARLSHAAGEPHARGTVPFSAAEEPAEAVCEGRPSALREQGWPVPGSSGQRVLVVDDHRDTADTLADLLELWGHAVEVAYSGARGLECARRFRPTAVLCKLGLPGTDGYELAAGIRQVPGAAGTLLIAITGFGSPEDRQRTREAGFQFHLTIPIDPEELLEALQTLSTP